MVGMQLPEKGKPRTQRVTEEDINSILAVSGYVDTLKTTKARTATAMLFALETAMRAGEICSLSWDNMNFEKRTAFLPMTKNGISKTVPLTKNAIAILERLKGGSGMRDCVLILSLVCLMQHSEN